FLELNIDSNDNRLARLTDSDTGKEYTSIKKSSGSYTEWKKELEPLDMQQYLISSVDGQSFPLLVYKSDNKTFQQAIIDHINNTEQKTFALYVQGGGSGSPMSGCCRGIFISDPKKT